MQMNSYHPITDLLGPATVNKENKGKEMETPYLFIDGSYFCFYCYFSVERWWKNAFPHQLEVLKAPDQNALFVEKFQAKYKKMLQTLPEKIGVKNPIIYIGKDCKREDIWRNDYFPGYKANRLNKNAHVAPFFQLFYQELSNDLGVSGVLEYPRLEADDCIAICVHHLYKENPEMGIYIVTSDRDYLQLVVSPTIHLYDLSFKKLTEMKGSSGNAECDLFCKIVMGDKSDNIPSVFPKCGPKTALKYFQNRPLFEARLKKENALQKWALNEKIIKLGADMIP
jgi:5'-3' exonuclease